MFSGRREARQSLLGRTGRMKPYGWIAASIFVAIAACGGSGGGTGTDPSASDGSVPPPDSPDASSADGPSSDAFSSDAFSASDSAPSSCTLPSTQTCDPVCEDECAKANCNGGGCPDCSQVCCNRTPGGQGVQCPGGACEPDLQHDPANCGS